MKKRAGRPRKFAVKRRSDGKPAESRSKDLNEPLRIQRMRSGLTLEQSGDPLVATSLGTALIKGHISSDQHRAGEEFARVVRRWWRLKGVQSPHPRCAGTVGGTGIEPDEREGIAATKAFNLALCNLSSKARVVCLDVCAHDRPIGSLELLREGLDSLARLYKIKRAA